MIFLSQFDPKWTSIRLGGSWLKMGRWGCATVALSMMSERFGCYRSPESLANDHKHYNHRGEIIWQNVEFQKMQFEKRLRYPNLKAIDESIAPGKGVMVEVNFAHWVLVLRKEDDRYIGADPWGGEEIDILKKYYRITGSAHYVEK